MEFLVIPLVLLLSANGNSTAAATASQAYLRQSGIDRMVDEYQQRELSEAVRNRVSQGFFLMRTITEQQIKYRLEFP